MRKTELDINKEELLPGYMTSYDQLIGDKRTVVAFRETAKGITVAGTLVCQRIAASTTVSGEYPASPQDTDAPSSPAGPSKEACALWQAALGELELQMTKGTFATWVRPAELLVWESEGDDNDSARTRVVLGTPNEYVKDWLENRLYTPIRRTLSGIAGNPVEVEFEVCERAQWNCPLEDGE
jgi:hypothetical protein